MENDLICSNAIRQSSEDLKPIICSITKKKCVCSSCLNPGRGFKMNTWAKDCPCFKSI